MNYFSEIDANYYGGNQKPKDINSNSALRGYEKRLAQLLIREQTPRIVKEIKKLYVKIENQKEKIRKRNDEATRPKQQTLTT